MSFRMREPSQVYIQSKDSSISVLIKMKINKDIAKSIIELYESSAKRWLEKLSSTNDQSQFGFRIAEEQHIFLHSFENRTNPKCSINFIYELFENEKEFAFCLCTVTDDNLENHLRFQQRNINKAPPKFPT